MRKWDGMGKESEMGKWGNVAGVKSAFGFLLW
jgi:hypothetical protein